MSITRENPLKSKEKRQRKSIEWASTMQQLHSSSYYQVTITGEYSVFLCGIFYQFLFFLFDNLSVIVEYLMLSGWCCRAAIGCCIVDGWVDGWCSDVSWIRRIPNRNATALLHNNIRNDQLLHWGCTVGFTVKPPRIQIITPQLVLLPELHYESARVLHRGSQVLHHQGTWDYATTYDAPTNDTEASAYYTTKAVEFYTGTPKYDRNQSS